MPNANAIGISPAKLEFNFAPNAKFNCDFLIVNNVWEGIDGEDLDVLIETGEELKDYITIERSEATLPPNQWIPVKCSINLPDNLKPGPNYGSILLKEASASTGGMVGTVAAVKMPITIRVPYPGKYLEGTFEIPTVEVGQKVEFRINVINRGDQNIDEAYSVIEVYDLNQNKLTEVTSDHMPILSGQQVNIISYWDAEDIGAGIYHAKA